MMLLNRVIIRIRITKGKRQIRFETLNLLGYMKKPDGRLYNITSLRYIKPYISKSLNPNEIGLLPSLSAIKRLFFRLTGKVIYFISFS